MNQPNDAGPRASAGAGLQQWTFSSVRHFIDSVSNRSTLGMVGYFGTNVRPHYAAYNIVVVLQRKFQIFILKTLIPAMILVAVVVASLYFPPGQPASPKTLGARAESNGQTRLRPDPRRNRAGILVDPCRFLNGESTGPAAAGRVETGSGVSTPRMPRTEP